MKKLTPLFLILFLLFAQKNASSQIITDLGSLATTSLITGTSGNEIVIPVNATVSSLTNIGSLTYIINYDPAIVTAISVARTTAIAGGSFGYTIGPANGLPLGTIDIEWGFGNKNLAVGSTNTCNITFRKVATGNSPLTFLTNDCVYANPTGDIYPGCTYVNGSIKFQVDAPISSAASITSCPGPVSIPVIVNNFNTIGAASLTLYYNSAVLTYVGYSGSPAFDFFNVTGSTAGQVGIGGLSFNGGLTLPTGTTLVTLNFTYKGGYTDLSWASSPGTLCDFSNADPTPVILTDSPFGNYYINGSVGPGTTTWLGGTSTDWGLLANWSCDVPMSHTDVIIPSGKPHYPVISSAGAAVNSLTINAGTVTINPTASLSANSLTNNVGSAALVLKSDATGTGSLIQNSTGVAATIERYITGSATLTANTYHLVSHPFTENYLSAAWMDSYLFDCDETTGNWIANGYVTTNTLYANKGYMIYYPGDSRLYSHTGTLQGGSCTLPVTYTGTSLHPGYNLLPNPYSSALDFDVSANWGGGVISNKIWIWNAVSGNYGSHIRAGNNTNGVSNIIPEGQGFFVEASSAGNVTINAAARVHNTSQQYLKKTDGYDNLLRVKAEGNNFSDEIVVQFRDDATSGYDDAIEAKKMIGQYEAPQLSSIASDNTDLSINCLPYSGGDVTVPLDFSLNASTDVTFTASGMESFLSSIPVYLEDVALNKMIDLRANPVYTFSHISGPAANRFQLRFMGVTGTPENPGIAGKVFVSNAHLFVEIPSMNQSEVTIAVYDALGRQFSGIKTVMNGITELAAPVVSGVYVVRVMNGTRTFTGKVIIN